MIQISQNRGLECDADGGWGVDGCFSDSVNVFLFLSLSFSWSLPLSLYLCFSLSLSNSLILSGRWGMLGWVLKDA